MGNFILNYNSRVPDGLLSVCTIGNKNEYSTIYLLNELMTS